MSLQLSSYFSGIGVKKLSQVEVDPSISNQHEFNNNKLNSLNIQHDHYI